MTTPRDPDRLIDAFLAEGPEALPDRTYDTVRGDIDRTRQRVVIGPWRESHMNNLAKLAIGLAAVLVVAVVGLNLLPGRGNIGGVAPTPSPTPSATPSSTPSPSVAELSLPAAGPLTAGTHQAVSEFDHVPFSFTVPDGWRSEGWFLTNDDGPSPYGLRVTFVPVGNLFADPCKDTLMDPALGPSVDDLAAALTTLPGTTAGAIQDVAIGGRDGKLVEYTIDKDLECTNGQFYLWRDRSTSNEGDFYTFSPYGDTVRTWAVDADGNRFVIMADIQPGTSEADKAELQAVVDSVTFP